MRIRPAALLAVMSAAIIPATARADDRADGTRAYREGRFAEALAAFEAAARARPTDPEPLADVALALQKLGRNDEAIAANRRVVELAARRGPAKPAKRAKIRQGAYFNLGRLGVSVRVPGEEACGAVETDGATCRQPLFACRKSRLDAGSGLGTVWDVLRVARNKQDAAFVKIDGEEEYHDYPPLLRGLTDDSYSENLLRRIDLSEQEGDGVMRYGVEEMGDECARHHGSEWTCDRSEAVRTETLRCVGDAEAGMISSLRTSPATAACFKKACDRASTAPWPAVKAEEAAHTKELFACYDGLSELEDATCVVAYADACVGFVGLYCTTTVSRRKGKPKPDRHRAFEIKIPPRTRTGG